MLVILQILTLLFSLFSIIHAWQHLQTTTTKKVIWCILIFLFGWIGAIVYWANYLGNKKSARPQKVVKKIGQQGPVINDVESALANIENRYRRFHRMLYDDDYGFGHFYALSDYRKDMILNPLKQILGCRRLHFSRISNDGNQFGSHYDFYLGELDQNNKRRFGVYSWEWEEDEDGDTSINYFVGSFENEQPKYGVWYHLSNEEAKIWVRVDGRFDISVTDGVSTLR